MHVTPGMFDKAQRNMYTNTDQSANKHLHAIMHKWSWKLGYEMNSITTLFTQRPFINAWWDNGSFVPFQVRTWKQNEVQLAGSSCGPQAKCFNSKEPSPQGSREKKGRGYAVRISCDACCRATYLHVCSWGTQPFVLSVVFKVEPQNHFENSCVLLASGSLRRDENLSQLVTEL